MTDSGLTYNGRSNHRFGLNEYSCITGSKKSLHYFFSKAGSAKVFTAYKKRIPIRSCRAPALPVSRKSPFRLPKTPFTHAGTHPPVTSKSPFRVPEKPLRHDGNVPYVPYMSI